MEHRSFCLHEIPRLFDRLDLDDPSRFRTWDVSQQRIANPRITVSLFRIVPYSRTMLVLEAYGADGERKHVSLSLDFHEDDTGCLRCDAKEFSYFGKKICGSFLNLNMIRLRKLAEGLQTEGEHYTFWKEVHRRLVAWDAAAA